MKLDGLIPLYKSMKSQSVERCQFNYKAGKAVFDVFFFIDSSPFVLLFGVKAENFSFEVEVKSGFIIDCELARTTYIDFCNALGLEYNPDRPFSPWKFFSEFNSKIPSQPSDYQEAKPHNIAPYKHIAEEADKIYFFGWQDNNKIGKNVRLTNLDKTRILLGEKAYQRCKKKNLSSRWTDVKEAAMNIEFPK